jgi:hypothetical protein
MRESAWDGRTRARDARFARRVRRASARVMRCLVLALAVAACGPRPGAEEPQEPMPSETLDHQNPAADTSKNPTLRTYGSRWSWGDFFHIRGPSNPFGETTGAAPHYYTGCGGCSSHGDAALVNVLLLAWLVARRRRR